MPVRLALSAAAFVALPTAAPAATVHLVATSTQGAGNAAHVYAREHGAFTPEAATWADGTAPETGPGNDGGVYQSPYNNTALVGTQTFFSVTGSETLTFATAQSSFTLLWGSIDSYNRIAFDNGLSWSGTDIVALLGLPGAGTNYEQVALVTFAFAPGEVFSAVTFQSAQPAFEFALARQPAPIPLPAAGWLLLAGAATLAGLARRRA